MDTPKAPLISQQALVILNNENEKRRAFCEWLDDDMKAEFINGEVVVHSPALDRHTEALMNLCMLLNVFVTKYDLGLLKQFIESKAVAGFAIPVRAVFDKSANMVGLHQLMAS